MSAPMLSPAEVREILARHGEPVDGLSDDDCHEIARRIYGISRVVLEKLAAQRADASASA